jgi:hypothetical protein
MSPDEYSACATPASITAEAYIGQVVGALLKEGVLSWRRNREIGNKPDSTSVLFVRWRAGLYMLGCKPGQLSSMQKCCGSFFQPITATQNYMMFEATAVCLDSILAPQQTDSHTDSHGNYQACDCLEFIDGKASCFSLCTKFRAGVCCFMHHCPR